MFSLDESKSTLQYWPAFCSASIKIYKQLLAVLYLNCFKYFHTLTTLFYSSLFFFFHFLHFKKLSSLAVLE